MKPLCSDCRKRPVYARGICHACYERMRRAGTLILKERPGPYERLMSRLISADEPLGCWTGRSVREDGYVTVEDSGRAYLAHRWMYEHFIAPIPEGLDLDHLCRNRACVNPWHLEPVTRRINTLRGDAPQIVSWRTDRCIRGHDLRGAYVRRDTGGRMCRECARERRRQYAQSR